MYTASSDKNGDNGSLTTISFLFKGENMPVISNDPIFVTKGEIKTDKKITIKIQGFSADDGGAYYQALINCQVVKYLCSDEACSFDRFNSFFNESIAVVEEKLWLLGLTENQIEEISSQLDDNFPNP